MKLPHAVTLLQAEGGVKTKYLVKSDRRKTLHFFTRRVNPVFFQNSFDGLWPGDFALK
jgi:hypothetical protein